MISMSGEAFSPALKSKGVNFGTTRIGVHAARRGRQFRGSRFFDTPPMATPSTPRRGLRRQQGSRHPHLRQRHGADATEKVSGAAVGD